MRTIKVTMYSRLVQEIQRRINNRDGQMAFLITYGKAILAYDLGEISAKQFGELRYMILNNRMVSPAVEVGR